MAGGAGFVGSHLCHSLLEQGYNVLCVDNYITGVPANIRSMRKSSNFAFRRRDISHPLKVDGALDAVMHLASAASPKDFQRFGPEIMKAGAAGTWNLLELAKKSGATFLLASSSEVYGDPQVHPQTEEYWGNVNPTGPRSPYDESKRYAEALTALFNRVHGVDVRIARIFNCYGPGQRSDDGRVIPAFMEEAARNEPLTIYGDGEQTRSFCYISDMVEGIKALLQSSVQTPVNLGNADEITINELAGLVEEVFGQPLGRRHLPLPQDDPRRRCPDISKAKSKLGWTPKVGLREGLIKTIETLPMKSPRKSRSRKVQP